jgi:putative spermidine/putrescine transport system substrate-binding protein
MEEPVLTGIELEDPLSEQERSFRGNEYNHLRPQVDEQEHYKYRRSNNVQKLTICLVLLMFAFLIVVLAVASATFHKLDDYIKSDKTVTVAYVSLGLPGYESYSWDDVLTRASGQTVRFNMWAGDTTINHWVKDWLAPKMLENYNIQIELVRLNDTVEAVETIAYEIGKGWTTNGTVDLVWINGENFRTAKEAGYLYGPFATKLPNAANFDFNSDNIKYDFGYPTNDYEMPYNGAQVVFIYNTKNITSPPLTIPDLVTWIKSHPGKFTYAAPPDFTGSVFVRHFWYSYASPYSQFLGNFNEKLYDQYASGVYKVLREIEPYLIQKNGAAYYPESQSDVDIMFKNGEVLITLSYDPQSASANVDDGFWNSTVQAYVLSTGTIANTNFVAIASNAENKLAAIVRLCDDHLNEVNIQHTMYAGYGKLHSFLSGYVRACPTCRVGRTASV